MRFVPMVLLLSVVLAVSGCGGSSASASLSPYAGTWSGTWVNVDDSTDAGTSTWTVDQNGNVDGQDFDPGRSTTFHVVGTVSVTGNLITQSTPTGGTPASLDGPLKFSGSSKMAGVLAWGVTPVLNYQYTFTRS